ncbi:MAG: MBL fold metallo-hydrolase [Alphaproteobacteria bacterium]|nr:MBL fold metallo-hydrolase [Alphaproteobacteria bacterium]
MSLQIQTFREPPFDNNNYVVIDEESHEAILVDCSAADETMMDYIKNQGATLKYILITHAHFDHILGVDEVMKKYQVPAYVHPADFPLLQDMNGWLTRLGFPTATIPNLSPLLSTLKIGQTSIQVIPTAGHTPGCVCYLIDNHLFSGDTLFRGTHGRVDIPLSDAQAIRESLLHLMELPDDITVYPGHGHPTTIGNERGWITRK